MSIYDKKCFNKHINSLPPILGAKRYAFMKQAKLLTLRVISYVIKKYPKDDFRKPITPLQNEDLYGRGRSDPPRLTP